MTLRSSALLSLLALAPLHAHAGVPGLRSRACAVLGVVQTAPVQALIEAPAEDPLSRSHVRLDWRVEGARARFDEALELRLPDLKVDDGPGGQPHRLELSDYGEQQVRLVLRLADGRRYRRVFTAAPPHRERIIAATLANLLVAIETRALAPDPPEESPEQPSEPTGATMTPDPGPRESPPSPPETDQALEPDQFTEATDTSDNARAEPRRTAKPKQTRLRRSRPPRRERPPRRSARVRRPPPLPLSLELAALTLGRVGIDANLKPAMASGGAGLQIGLRGRRHLVTGLRTSFEGRRLSDQALNALRFGGGIFAGVGLGQTAGIGVDLLGHIDIETWRGQTDRRPAPPTDSRLLQFGFSVAIHGPVFDRGRNQLRIGGLAQLGYSGQITPQANLRPVILQDRQQQNFARFGGWELLLGLQVGWRRRLTAPAAPR